MKILNFVIILLFCFFVHLNLALGVTDDLFRDKSNSPYYSLDIGYGRSVLFENQKYVEETELFNSALSIGKTFFDMINLGASFNLQQDLRYEKEIKRSLSTYLFSTIYANDFFEFNVNSKIFFNTHATHLANTHIGELFFFQEGTSTNFKYEALVIVNGEISFSRNAFKVVTEEDEEYKYIDFKTQFSQGFNKRIGLLPIITFYEIYNLPTYIEIATGLDIYFDPIFSSNQENEIQFEKYELQKKSFVEVSLGYSISRNFKISGWVTKNFDGYFQSSENDEDRYESAIKFRLIL